MNLAEIRKKAQQGGKPVEAPAASVPQAAPQVVAPDVAAPQVAALPPMPSDDDFPAQHGEFQWDYETAETVEAGAYESTSLPERFDPLEVILKGRETAALGVDAAVSDNLGAAAVELLCFKVGDEEYAISIMDIKEIIKPREVTEVPKVPTFVRGVLSLRGIIIPIFDIRERLGLPGAAKSERERVVVVNRQSGFCGILVDEVVQVVRVAQSGIEPPPVVLEGIDREFVQGIGRVAGRMLILLDMEKVLDVDLRG